MGASRAEKRAGIIRRAPSMALVVLIEIYRKLVSPLIRSRCRYYPSCSRYALDAVQRYGVFKGLVLATWRLLRCNPFSKGGIDHVHDQRVFNTSPKEGRLSVSR